MNISTMHGYKISICLVLITSTFDVEGFCPSSILSSLSFVLEYVVWRGWHQAVLYTPQLESDCNWAVVRLVKCLGLNGVGAAVVSGGKVRLRYSLGVIVFAPQLNDNTTEKFAQLLDKLSENKMNTSPYDWLIAARSEQDFRNINKILNVTAIRFDQNLVVGYPIRTKMTSLGLCDGNFVYASKINKRKNNRKYHHEEDCNARDPSCSKTNHEKNYFRSSDRFRNLTRHSSYKSAGKLHPLYRSGIMIFNYSRTFQMTNITDFSVKSQYLSLWQVGNVRIGKSAGGIHMVQYFKVRVNGTLYGHYLGTWNRQHSMSNVETLYPVEARSFLGEELVVGRCNATDGTTKPDDDGATSPTLLDDTLYFLTVRLNATPSTRYFTKLGFRTYEGAWTGLLGSLVDHSVDLALEPVTAHTPPNNDMDFIFPIAETMCNIYIRHQETSTVRDIFLAPFSPRLLTCVVAVVVVAALAVALVSRLAPDLMNCRHMEYAEALLWSTGILCQQGGSHTPRSPAASTLLVVLLLFAVVTYNSYAAFITSVLSVRVASVDTAAAVLYSTNFKIGYIRNGADQMYLMSTKDAVLNTFYIRGYSDAENLVSTAEEGLARAAFHDYAFFAGQRSARSTLRSLSQARGRCALRELPVPSTKAQLAFPMTRRSPYARPTLVSLLQLRSGGTLARLGAALVPAMPQCDLPAGFASARATDVISALILLAIGLISAFLLGIGEYCWKNRMKIHKLMVKLFNRLLELIR